MPKADRDRPSADRPDAEDERLVHRMPEPPGDHSVTVNHQDGTFIYRPKLDGEDPERL